MYELLSAYKALHDGVYRPTRTLSKGEQEILLIRQDEAYSEGYLDLCIEYDTLPPYCPPNFFLRITQKGLDYLRDNQNNDKKQS
jgi:hypothetical protein